MDRGSSSSSSSHPRREAPTTIGARTPSGLSDFTQAKVREAENRLYLLHDVLGDPSSDHKLKGRTRDRLDALGKLGLFRSWEGIDDHMSNESGFSFLPREYISRIYIRHYEYDQRMFKIEETKALKAEKKEPSPAEEKQIQKRAKKRMEGRMEERIEKSVRLASPQGGLRLRHLIIAALYHLAHSPEDQLITRCQSGELQSLFRGFCLTSAALLGFLVRYGTPRLLQIIYVHTGMLRIHPVDECPADQAGLGGMTEFELNLVHARYEEGWGEPDTVTSVEHSFWEANNYTIDSKKKWRRLEPQIGSKILVFSVEGQVVDYFVNPTAMAAYRNDPKMLQMLDRCYGERLQTVLQVSFDTRMVRNPTICLLNRLYCEYMRFKNFARLPARRSLECLVRMGMYSGMPQIEWLTRFESNFANELSDNLLDMYDDAPSWTDYYSTGHLNAHQMPLVRMEVRTMMEMEIYRIQEAEADASSGSDPRVVNVLIRP